MKRVFLFIFLSILLLIIVLERKSKFTVGTKYTYNNAFVNSVVSNSYNRPDSEKYTSGLLYNVARGYRNVRSNKVRHAGFMDLVDSLIFSKTSKYNQIHYNRRKEYHRNYENSFKKSLENNSMLQSLQDKDIDRYRRMAELRMLNNKYGVIKAFDERDKSKHNLRILEEERSRLYRNKSKFNKLLDKYNKTQTNTFEEILADPKVSKRNKGELTRKKRQINSYNKKMKKLDLEIEKATLKLETNRSKINKANRKAKNARKKYNDKQKRKKDRKEIISKINIKSLGKKFLKSGKKRIAVA